MIDVADWDDADKRGKGKDMMDRLSKLVAIFDNPTLDFLGNRAEGNDLPGDTYEYPMRHFATESGKGQFFANPAFTVSDWAGARLRDDKRRQYV